MVPLAAIMAIGYLFKKAGLLNEDVLRFISKFLFYMAMPALAFTSIAAFDFGIAFNGWMVLHNLAVTLAAFLLGLVFVMMVRDKRRRGAFHMAFFRSNQGYIGMNAARAMFGEAGLAKASVVNGFDNPLVNILSVIGLELFKGKEEDIPVQKRLAGMAGSILLNPFVIAVGLGLAESAWKTGIAEIFPVQEFLLLLSKTALPLALILIGGSVSFRNMGRNMPQVLFLSTVKLIMVPLMAYATGRWLFQLPAQDLGLNVLLLSTPVAVSSYVFAREMGSDGEFMASCIGFSTMASMVTMPLMILCLRI
ncbi:MAG: AEC family transporter [Clostridia bacterium]